ncbi:hypothetical protein B0H13DRAFT_1889547 [Mycena leptocephala]|nr:hypothetical protein B0H13DRAFT_1889547 [Mycena leptocephala]
MFSKLISLALCVLSTVKAFPNPMGCGSAIEVPLRTWLLPRRNLVDTQTGPAPFKIVNLGVNGSAFVFEGGGTCSPTSKTLTTWPGYQTGGDKYIIKNIGLNAWVSVEKETGRLAVLPGVGAVEFAVESAGHNVWVIKEPFEDLLWEAIYDGSSMRFGYVTLRKSPGSQPGYQHWTLSR